MFCLTVLHAHIIKIEIISWWGIFFKANLNRHGKCKLIGIWKIRALHLNMITVRQITSFGKKSQQDKISV